MRQEPIEIAIARPMTRCRLAEKTGKPRDAASTTEPTVIDEAFARLDATHTTPERDGPSDGRIMKRALVSDLAAQLEAIDRQRERLVKLLQSVETNSIAD
jgi:hypothetical protein